MTWTDYGIIVGICIITMVICRVAPLMLLKGRELPDSAQRALNLIPPAAFAALIANDLFKLGMFDAGLWPACAPLIASLLVLIVGYKTKSLVWCIIVGVVSYALLTLI